MLDDRHSESDAPFATNWPALIGVALLVPIAVSGPIVSLMFLPASSESREPAVQNVTATIAGTVASSSRLPFQGPPAPVALPAFNPDAVTANETKAAADDSPRVPSAPAAVATPVATKEALHGSPDDARLASSSAAGDAPRAAMPATSSSSALAAQGEESKDELPSPDEYDLRDELARVAKTIDLQAFDATTISQLRGHGDASSSLAALKQVVAQRSDLEGLPFEEAENCRLDAAAAKKLHSISTEVQTVLGQLNAARSRSLSSASSEPASFAYLMETNAAWRTLEAVPALVQTMQVQEAYDRSALVDVLAYIPDRTTSVALARRALFDLSEAVRDEAIAALAKRPPGEFRDELVSGFRYPWSRAAEHAARALVQLDDKDAVPELVDLLDAPNPQSPRQQDNKWVVDELVRVNHLRNCVLCHAPSTSQRDLVRGFVPTPGQPIPESYIPCSSRGPFVRAETTYIRQDFSVMHRLENQEPWPDVQRFDYFVRTRQATPDEVRDFTARCEPQCEPPSYPQRKAILFALRRLTGVDLGDGAAAWRDRL